MANYRDGYLEQGAPVGLQTYELLLTADNTLVDVTRCRLLKLGSNNTTATNRTFTITNPLAGNAELTIVFTTGSSSKAELLSTGNVKLSSTWTAGENEALHLVFNGTYWIEIGRKTPTAPASIALADAHILVGDALGAAADVAVTGDVTISNTGVTAIGAAKVLETMLPAPSVAGLGAKRIAKAIYNTAAGFGTGAHTLGVTIPTKAFVTGMWYWVETTFTSATDAATLAISIQGANDCVSAVAISDGSNPWDTTTKPVEGIPVLETTSSWLATSAARAITVTTAVETITAGVMHVWVEYIAYP